MAGCSYTPSPPENGAEFGLCYSSAAHSLRRSQCQSAQDYDCATPKDITNELKTNNTTAVSSQQTPRVTPDNSSHNHMYTKVLYHTARVLPRLSAALHLHGLPRPERHGSSSRGCGSHGSWIKHKYPAYQAPSILCHFQPPPLTPKVGNRRKREIRLPSFAGSSIAPYVAGRMSHQKRDFDHAVYLL